MTALAAIVGLPVVLAAQAPAPSVSLQDLIVRTLQTNPEVRMSRAALDGVRGALVQAAQPFDARPWAALGGSRTFRGGAVAASSLAESFASASSAGASKLFRSGIEVTADMALARSGAIGTGSLLTPAASQFSASGAVTVPLMQGTGGGLFAAQERAARQDAEAGVGSLRDAAGAAVLDAVLAYWEYRAAYERAEVQRAATRRSDQSVDEVRILIDADERPASDLDLMLANTAGKRAQQEQAERQIVSARTRLALAVGLSTAEAAALPAPGTTFPTPTALDALSIDALIGEALAAHPGLAAAQRRRDGARQLREGAVAQLRPRLDLLFAAGYEGADRRQPALGSNASVNLRFEPASTNSGLRGALLRVEAVYESSTVAVEALTRTITLNVTDAVAGLVSSERQLASTHEAVGRARRARDSVQRNFELGMATLFDRILAEDVVTNAELADLSTMLQYASALARLQFARGAVLDARDDRLVAGADRFLVLSLENPK